MSDLKNKLQANKKYEAKLSWKRKEVIETTNQIEEFAANNFNIDLPSHKKELKKRASINEDYSLFLENFPQVSNFYYQVKYSGQSIASLFNNGNEIDTYTHAHMYSKHRLDEVWNWRKSVLIRNIYRKYLQETKIYKHYTPVHIVLTLPHADGKYQGKKFYTKELIEHFNILRKHKDFKAAVYGGGEYGVEHKKSITNGYHIHIHSLTFLKIGNINEFRETLQKLWFNLTGATQIWVEGLFYYKKDDKGKFINEVIYNKNIKEEDPNGEIETIFGERIVRRKKFYIENEAKAIRKDKNLTAQEQDEKIESCYLSGIMECIKYHFKNDCTKDKNGKYDIEVMEEVLENTKGKRLYSRFGQFYKVKELCFNNLSSNQTDAAQEEEEVIGSVKSEFAINPFTGEEVAAQETELVLFDPAKRQHQSAKALKPYALITQSTKIYHSLDAGLTVKEAIRSVLNSMYGDKNKKNKKVKNKGKTPNNNNYKP